MRLTVSLEGNTEGRILASVDMEEIVKMTITDDIEKSNFNPQMFKACTDTSYQCGYEQGRADAISEFVKALEEHQQKNWIDNLEYGITFADIEEVAEQLKEQE